MTQGGPILVATPRSSAAYFGEIGWRTALQARAEQLPKFEKTAYLQLSAGRRPAGRTGASWAVIFPRTVGVADSET